MQEVYTLLQETDMLVIASPIYYHGISGQLKCVIDRFYSAAYPSKPSRLKNFLLKGIFLIIWGLRIWGFLLPMAAKTVP